MFFKINTNLQNYIVEWNQHVRLVDLHRKHPQSVRGNAHLRPSIQYTYFPMVWCCLFGFRAIMYLMAHRGLANVDEAWREFWLRAGEKYTRSSSMNIQISILIWTLNYFLVTIADFRLTVDVLKFMIVYSVGKPWGRTRPKDLGEFALDGCGFFVEVTSKFFVVGLSRKDYDSVVRLRTIVLVLLRFSIISITIMVFVFELHHSWETNQFSKYFFYTIASWLGGSYWVLHICQGKKESTIAFDVPYTSASWLFSMLFRAGSHHHDQPLPETSTTATRGSSQTYEWLPEDCLPILPEARDSRLFRANTNSLAEQSYPNATIHKLVLYAHLKLRPTAYGNGQLLPAVDVLYHRALSILLHHHCVHHLHTLLEQVGPQLCVPVRRGLLGQLDLPGVDHPFCQSRAEQAWGTGARTAHFQWSTGNKELRIEGF